jgi:two-component system sensor histidine kinase KdpD
MEPLLPATPPKSYAGCIGLIILTTLVGWLLKPYISQTNLLMFYLLVVVLTAFLWGLRPAILSAILGVLAFDFFFVTPYLSFRISDTEYVITFIGLIVVAGVISLLVARAREHAFAAQVRERETSTLFALSQDLTVAADIHEVINAVTKHIGEIFGWECVFLISENSTLAQYQGSPGLSLDADEIAVATWAFSHDTIAGYDTDTLHSSRLRYIPLRTNRGKLGILGVKPEEPDGVINPEQSRLLMAFANQVALAIERVNVSRVYENKDECKGT